MLPDSALTNTTFDQSSFWRGPRILSQDLVQDLPPETHESLVSRKTVAEVPSTGLTFQRCGRKDDGSAVRDVVSQDVVAVRPMAARK